MTALLKMMFRLLLVSVLGLPLAHATTIDFSATQLGDSRWRYDYVIHNDSLGSALDEFTIFFDHTLFGNLGGATGPAGWDLLVIQPDDAIPAAGFFDGLAPAGAGIAPGASLGGFSVSFDYFGPGMPGAQVFSIVDPLTFIELDSGMTGSGVVPVPVSGTFGLLAIGLAMGAVAQRRQGGRP